MVTMTEISTMVDPTTYVSVYVSTEVKDKVSNYLAVLPLFDRPPRNQTKTVMNTVTATMTDNKTYLQTTTYMTTATQTQQVLQTGLSDCLGKVNKRRRFNTEVSIFLMSIFFSANQPGRCPLVIATATIHTRQPCHFRHLRQHLQLRPQARRLVCLAAWEAVVAVMAAADSRRNLRFPDLFKIFNFFVVQTDGLPSSIFVI